MDIPSILKRAADKTGFIRTHWLEKDIPTNIENICVMMFFGDVRACSIMSSLLLKRYREQVKGSKYFIICTWPGYEGLFPCANEHWVIRDELLLRKFFKGAINFQNNSDLMVQFRKGLNHWFDDVIGEEVIAPYYDNGIKQEFWDRFKHVKKYMLNVPSSTILGDLNKKLIKNTGMKIVVYPVESIRSWNRNQLEHLDVPKEFWISLVKRLLSEGFTPVVYQDFSTYDISADFGDSCIFVANLGVLKLLSLMRTCGFVLDMFSGISRLAILARTPFMAIDERNRYNSQKEFEIDDLCAPKSLPRQYIFSFPTIIRDGNEKSWKVNIFDLTISKLFSILPNLDRDKWPSPLESEEVMLYQNVRRQQLRKMGTRFIKVNRDLRDGSKL